MKTFLKNEFAVILVILFLLWFAISSNYNYKKEYERNTLAVQKDYAMICKDYPNEKFCDPNYEIPKIEDAITIFTRNITGPGQWNIDTVAPFLIIIAASCCFHKKYRSGFFKYEISRMGYKKLFKKNIRRILLISLILPVFAILFFIGSFIISEGNLDLKNTIEVYPNIYTLWKPYQNNIPLYFFVYLLNLFLNGVFYCNLGLFFVKKNKNIFVSILLSFIGFLVLAIISEVFIGNLLLRKILKIDIMASLNLFSFWEYSYTLNLGFMVGVALFLAIGSSIANYFNYRNKEGVIIESEK